MVRLTHPKGFRAQSPDIGRARSQDRRTAFRLDRSLLKQQEKLVQSAQNGTIDSNEFCGRAQALEDSARDIPNFRADGFDREEYLALNKRIKNSVAPDTGENEYAPLFRSLKSGEVEPAKLSRTKLLTN